MLTDEEAEKAAKHNHVVVTFDPSKAEPFKEDPPPEDFTDQIFCGFMILLLAAIVIGLHIVGRKPKPGP